MNSINVAYLSQIQQQIQLQPGPREPVSLIPLGRWTPSHPEPKNTMKTFYFCTKTNKTLKRYMTLVQYETWDVEHTCRSSLVALCGGTIWLNSPVRRRGVGTSSVFPAWRKKTTRTRLFYRMDWNGLLWFNSDYINFLSQQLLQQMWYNRNKKLATHHPVTDCFPITAWLCVVKPSQNGHINFLIHLQSC